MNVSMIGGLVIGAAAGGAAGVAIEHATRPAAHPTDARDTAWTDAFNAHFRDEQATDADLERQRAARLAAYLEAHPPPRGVHVDRTSATWRTDRPVTVPRDGFIPLTVFGSFMGGTLAVLIGASLVTPSGERLNHTPLRSFGAGMLYTTIAAAAIAAIGSDLSDPAS